LSQSPLLTFLVIPASKSQLVGPQSYGRVYGSSLFFSACRTLESAKALSEGVKLARPISLDVMDENALDAEIAKHDLVISLIPYTLHAQVIRSACRQKKHVVTTSYVSPAMLELNQAAIDAGITVMNEIGVGYFPKSCLS
jgi:saccharopine dehydrogenase-like NADP-dependent oxidoreductase